MPYTEAEDMDELLLTCAYCVTPIDGKPFVNGDSITPFCNELCYVLFEKE